MRLPLIFIFLISCSCASRPQIVEKPFDFTSKWQEGSFKTHSNESGEIEIIFPAGEFGPSKAGFNWATDIEPRDQYTISYEVKFAESFDFVKGGKLPGLCAGHGEAGTKPTGADKMSARIMWRHDGNVVSYVYHLDQKTGYGDDFEWSKNDKFLLQFIRGQWAKIKFTVKLNSIGNADGSIIGFFNGERAVNKSGIRFRNTGTLKIHRLCFNTFFGGNDKSWAPASEQKLWIRDLKLE